MSNLKSPNSQNSRTSKDDFDSPSSKSPEIIAEERFFLTNSSEVVRKTFRSPAHPVTLFKEDDTIGSETTSDTNDIIIDNKLMEDEDSQTIRDYILEKITTTSNNNDDIITKFKNLSLKQNDQNEIETIILYQEYKNIKDTTTDTNSDFYQILKSLEKLTSREENNEYFKYVRNYKVFLQQMLLSLKTIIKDLLEILIIINKDNVEKNKNYINNVIINHIKDIEEKMKEQTEHMTNMILVIKNYGKEINITEKSLKLSFGSSLLKMEFLLISFLKGFFQMINTEDIKMTKKIKKDLIKILEEIELLTNNSLSEIRSDLRSVKNIINLQDYSKKSLDEYKLLKSRIKDTIQDTLKLYHYYVNK